MFLYRDEVVASPLSIINNNLERDIALEFYATTFSLVGRTFFSKKIPSVFHSDTHSVFYEQYSINGMYLKFIAKRYLVI